MKTTAKALNWLKVIGIAVICLVLFYLMFRPLMNRELPPVIEDTILYMEVIINSEGE